MSMNIAPVDEELRSVALPFAVKPKNLNGELVGDFGFDPFKFTDNGKHTALTSGSIHILASHAARLGHCNSWLGVGVGG